MRVLHVVNASYPEVSTGYTSRTRSVLLAQRRAGFEPAVLSLDFGHRRAEEAKTEWVDGVEHVRLSYPLDVARARLADAVRSFALRGAARAPGLLGREGRIEVLVRWALAQAEPILARLRPDVVHAHSPFWVARVGRGLARKASVPWVYELRGLWADSAVAQGEDVEGSLRHRWELGAESSLARSADGCLPIGEVLAAEVRSWGGRVLGVAANVVDIERFVPGPPPEGLRARAGLGAGPVVGYVGSLRPLEGLENALDGLAALPGAQLLVVGDGESRRALEQMSARRGLAERVRWVGRVAPDEVPAWYRLIDVFWVTRPPHRVTRLVTPLKPLEAMATGLPVVASHLPALVELVGDFGRRGLTYDPERPRQLAKLTARLLEDRPRREAIGSAARRWIEQHRTLQSLSDVYGEAFSRLTIASSTSR